MTTTAEKAKYFRGLLTRPGAFVSAHAWDVGTARILTSLGYEAIGTASSGYAHPRGRKDAENGVTRDEMMAWAGSIAAATHLPVTADLENGFGDSPEECAVTIRLAAEAGLVAGSIEDATGEGHGMYSLAHATERVRSAAAAARALPFPFAVVARADGFLHGHKDRDEVIRRLRSYEDAGADMLFAPGLDLEGIKVLCKSVTKPVIVLAGRGGDFSFAEAEAAGVKEVGMGSTLYRTAMGVLFDAAKEWKEKGTFTFEAKSVHYDKLQALMRGKKEHQFK